MVELLSPKNGYIFDTYTSMQREFIEKIHNCGLDAAVGLLPEKGEKPDFSRPQGLIFSWAADDETDFVLELSENKDFSDSQIYNTNEKSIEIDNFKVDTTYYWRVNRSAAQIFKTKDNLFRFINVDGIVNVRDIGGKNIKQGIIYRGTALGGIGQISEEGIKTFVERLKIKTEIELRKEATWTIDSPSMVDGVKLYYRPYRAYMHMFEEEGRAELYDILKLFTKEENYPIYFHCYQGADRTGMLAIILRSLAEENEPEIHTDYELTSMSTVGENRTYGVRSSTYIGYMEIFDGLKEYGEDLPFHTRVEKFVISCGITPEEIEKIKSIIKK